MIIKHHILKHHIPELPSTGSSSARTPKRLLRYIVISCVITCNII